MFATLVAKLIAFLAGKGIVAGGAVAPYVVMLSPALFLVGSGLGLYLMNKADTASLVLMAGFAVNEAIVAAQIAAAAKS